MLACLIQAGVFFFKTMEKEITIKLTPREAFAIQQAGVRKLGRRKKFETIGLKLKFQKQVCKKITAQQLDELIREWKSFSVIEQPEPKKKVIKKQPPKKSPSGIPSSRDVLGDF